MKWVLGITAVQPIKWQKHEPKWKETMVVSSNDTFYEIANKLCETTVKEQRKPGGLTYHVDDQFWTMKITSFDDATSKRDPFDPFDWETRTLATRNTRLVKIVTGETFDVWEYENETQGNNFFKLHPCTTKIRSSLLKEGQVIFFEYDQTMRYLKVLDVAK